MRAVESVDYEAVLADLRDKRAKLDAAIAAIEQFMLGRPASAESEGAEGAPPPRASENVESDSFFGLSAIEAAKKFLRMKKRPQAAKTIHDAILEGGYTTTAKNFYANLYTAMMRSDDLVNLGGRKGWGLAEWYPGRPKNRPEEKAAAEKPPQEEKPPANVPKRVKKPTGAGASPAASPVREPSAPGRPGGQSASAVAN